MTDRRVITHVVKMADELVIMAADEPGHGGAHHRYEISGMDFVTNPSWDGGGLQYREVILFQNGVIPEKGVNGLTNEALLAIVADRLESFQAGPFRGAYNANALEHVNAALNALKERTMERMSRKVEGTHEV